MVVQSIQKSSQINPERGAHVANLTPVSAAGTTRSTWKKFSWDTSTTLSGSVDVNANFVELYDQMEAAWLAGRFDEAIKGIDVILEKYLPAANDLFRAALLVSKSKCYEEMGRFDEALAVSEEALLAVKNHETTLDSFIGDRYDDVAHPIRFLEFRRAALLLLNGQEEAGFEALRNNQPTQVSGALLYHVLEKRSGQSLLEFQPSEKEDLKSLFMAGRYEEILEKTANLPEKPPFCFDDSEYRVRAAALAVVGRLDEALELYQGESYTWRSSESENIHQLIRALNGDEVTMGSSINYELDTGVPVALFLKWVSGS